MSLKFKYNGLEFEALRSFYPSERNMDIRRKILNRKSLISIDQDLFYQRAMEAGCSPLTDVFVWHKDKFSSFLVVPLDGELYEWS
jgi:hypothetical protein